MQQAVLQVIKLSLILNNVFFPLSDVEVGVCKEAYRSFGLVQIETLFLFLTYRNFDQVATTQ
jgi:hypothetical protein